MEDLERPAAPPAAEPPAEEQPAPEAEALAPAEPAPDLENAPPVEVSDSSEAAVEGQESTELEGTPTVEVEPATEAEALATVEEQPATEAEAPTHAEELPAIEEQPAATEELPEPEPAVVEGEVSMEELLPETAEAQPVPVEDAQLRAVIEAIVYVAEEPLTLAQLSAALHEPTERVRSLLDQLVEEFDKPEHGVTIREVAGGFKMATKPEHHEAVRSFVKSLKPPLKLSLPALETLAVIAYKQPVTAPEIQEIRGVQGAGVLKTLLDRKLIAVAGRKNVIGKPMLYKTTKEFLIQFGLKDLAELPSLKEFEEIRRLALSDEPATPTPEAEAAPEPAPEPEPEPAAEPEQPTEA
jgi:segregation and condensation protein B